MRNTVIESILFPSKHLNFCRTKKASHFSLERYQDIKHEIKCGLIYDNLLFLIHIIYSKLTFIHCYFSLKFKIDHSTKIG